MNGKRRQVLLPPYFLPRLVPLKDQKSPRSNDAGQHRQTVTGIVEAGRIHVRYLDKEVDFACQGITAVDRRVRDNGRYYLGHRRTGKFQADHGSHPTDLFQRYLGPVSRNQLLRFETRNARPDRTAGKPNLSGDGLERRPRILAQKGDNLTVDIIHAEVSMVQMAAKPPFGRKTQARCPTI